MEEVKRGVDLEVFERRSEGDGGLGDREEIMSKAMGGAWKR